MEFLEEEYREMISVLYRQGLLTYSERQRALIRLEKGVKAENRGV